MENEIWKQTFIDGISVSSLGRVKRDRDGYIIKPRTNKTNGYNYVDLRWHKNGKMIKVSRLVALTFIPNPNNKSDVDHINTIRTDDTLNKLSWATRSENMNNEVTKLKVLSRPFESRAK